MPVRDPNGIDQRAALPSDIQYNDMIAVARGNKLYKTEHMNLPSRITARVPLVTPAATDFATWVHQNGSVLHEMSDGLRLWHDSSIGSGTNVSSRVRSLPGGSWDVQLACIKGFTFKRDISAGLVLRESATGKLLTFGFGHPNGGNIQWFQYNSPTSFQDNIRSAQERNVGAAHFFRARLVGANVEMLASPDGACWATFGTLALTTGFTTGPDQWGFFLEPVNSVSPTVDAQFDIVHWDE